MSDEHKHNADHNADHKANHNADNNADHKADVSAHAPPADDHDYWLDRPSSINLIVRVLVIACIAVVLADFFYHKHGHFGFQEWFAFDAVFGFLAYVGLVSSAKGVRKLLMRSEDYYE